ncbi:MAG: hypothetical protein GY694_16950 [Gammaproteobacteria bacterium]|nr:hypothetical protein [Gammaproteobacteria bacterium]
MANFEDNPHTGRKRILANDSKETISQSLGKRHKSTRKIAKYLQVNNIQSVHHTTIWRELKRLGAKPRRRQTVPRKCRHWRENRMKFCRQYSHHDLNFWQNDVIFSDESFYSLTEKHNRHNDIVWMTDDLIENPETTQILEVQQDKHPKKIMVWAGFSGRGVTDLQFIEPGHTIDSTFYCESILNHLLFEIDERDKNETKEDIENYDITTVSLVRDCENWWFLHDNAPAHNSRQTRHMIANEDSFSHVFDWPGCSPDLNPIENLWSILDDSVYVEPLPTTLDELKKRITEAWSNLSPIVLQKLAGSMKHRIEICVSQNGGKTGY